MELYVKYKNTPQWAVDILNEELKEFKHYSIRWRYTDYSKYSSGHHSKNVWYPMPRIVITAGSIIKDQKLVLLHEIAHALTPTPRKENGVREVHGRAFWRTAWKLYFKYMPEEIDYIEQREKRYRKLSAEVLKEFRN